MSGQARKQPRRRSRWRITIALCLGALVAACSSSAASPPVRTGEPPTDQIPVIVDTDLELSDIAALAILLRDPAVDVRAITIAGTGAVHCEAGRRVMRYLLDELGSPDIPFGCGREDGGPDAHPFPDEWRARADAAFGLDIPEATRPGVALNAVGVITKAVEASPSAPTLVALGPLTNVEDALAAEETLADHLAGIHAMVGTVDAPGDVIAAGVGGGDLLEWDSYADPSAVAAVLSSDVPVSIVPLDATDDVPVPADLVDRLQADHEAAGADLVYELLVRNPTRLRSEDGEQLRDELAALAIADPDLVDWEDAAVSVGEDGRIVRDEEGRSIRFAASADRAGVESALLDALQRGEPRATPFILAGRLSVTFDGATCAVTGSSDAAGVHQLTYKGPVGEPSATSVIGIAAPHSWDEVAALLPTLDATASPPPWMDQGPTATDPEGAGTDVTAAGTLEDGIAGVMCRTGDAADVRYVTGPSFPVGGGAIPKS